MKSKLFVSSMLAAALAGVCWTTGAWAKAPPPPPASVEPVGADPKAPVVAAGWKVETVMIHPKINTPSVVCALPDGRVLVAEHWLSNTGGRDPIDRILCVHPDGHITTFAEGLYAVFGLAYLDGKVYVHHMPKFSVFTDDNGVGKDRKDVIDQTGVFPVGTLTDHLPAQIRLGMDGYFYMAVGDRGFYGAKSNVDGKAGQLQGGGIVRIRPDGTDLEVYSSGTRNHLDVSVSAEDELFTYDNTDDGHGWWSRFTHMVDGGFYGYPWDYKPTENRNDPASTKTPTNRDINLPYQPYTLWRMAEYGGGSPTGAIGYNEDALPEEFRGNLFHCEWGKGTVERFVVERDGATYKVVKHENLLSKAPGGELRPVGITVAADGTGFYVTDWGYGGWMQNKDSGRLLKVTFAGPTTAAPKPAWFVPAATHREFTATTADLIAGLRHPAESVRLVAQRRLAERGQEAVAPLVALLNDAKAPAPARWFAIWTLDRIDGGKAGREAVVKIAGDGKEDASVRRQAARQLGTRRATEGTQALVAALGDPDASVRFQAATALGRVGNAAAVPALLAKLGEQDLFARYAVFTALNRIGRSDPKAWPAILKGLESGDQNVLAYATFALRNTYDNDLVSALTQLAFDKSKPAGARSAAVLSEATLYKMPRPWEGKWWGTQPVGSPRPPKDVDWAGTTTVASTIQDLLKDGDPAVRAAAIKAMQIAPDPSGADALIALFNSEKSVELRRDVLKALAAGRSPKAAPLAVAVVKDAANNAPLLPDAIAVIEQVGGAEAGAELVALVGGDAPKEVLVPAFGAIGALKLEAAVPPAARHLADKDAVVWNAAVAALTQIGGKASADALAAALADARPEIRKAAAVSLGTLRARSAIPALIQAANSPQTRDEATAALCRMPTPDALDVYLRALGGRNNALKNQSRQALASIAPQVRPQIEAKIATLSPDALAAVQAIYDVVQPVTRWSVVGPFAAGEDHPFAPDKPADYPARGAELKGLGGKNVQLKAIQANPEHGQLDLAAAVSPNENVTSYLVGEFNSPAERDVEIVVGSDDTATVWLNGQKVYEDAAGGSYQWDKGRVKTHAKAGRNVVLARVGNNSGPYAFSLGVSGERTGKLFESVAAAKKPDRDAYAKFALTSSGNADNGKKIFNSTQTTGCVKCHQVNPTEGGTVGPSLQGVGVRYDRAKLIESVLYPSKQIFDGYEQWSVKLKNDDVQWGVIRAESDAEIVMYDSAAQKYIIRKADIASRKKSDLSLMPEGLEGGLTPQEFADLVSFLESLKEAPPATQKAK